MPAASAIRVLVVDDQMTMRALVRSALQQMGITDVGDAVDGEDGLKQLALRPVELVISDYNMPKVDGLEFLKAIRGQERTRKSAFIMLTGRSDKELVQRAVQYGVNNYLAKPFTTAELKKKIEQVFGPLS
ncbi:chemotaxis regulator [alpha proteobacterium U9-1i]|nr:chemotaxis regulator [alpha proteobacterium U9-1i]